ncbi:MAG: helix-turn-helix transcriptional regulator [Clostridiaceae bacterium]
MEVKLARIKKHMTQEELCKVLKISKTTLGNIERGNFDNMKIGLAKKISKTLDIPIEKLL